MQETIKSIGKHRQHNNIVQICPYPLVVQDISLSRRQGGFDFPWEFYERKWLTDYQ
ncbi:unnamed protein product [Musa hybrid cultivar]